MAAFVPLWDCNHNCRSHLGLSEEYVPLGIVKLYGEAIKKASLPEQAKFIKRDLIREDKGSAVEGVLDANVQSVGISLCAARNPGDLLTLHTP